MTSASQINALAHSIAACVLAVILLLMTMLIENKHKQQLNQANH